MFMNNQPLIFIFTCVYNDKKHISKLFDSISKQTNSNFVYYLYDDCSTLDNYDDLFNELNKNLNKKGIKCYFERGKVNLGINKATEYCIKLIKDKFSNCTHFMWINSDDWLEPNYVEVLTKYIAANKCTLYIPNLYKHYMRENDDKHIEIGYLNKQMRNAKTFLVDYINLNTIYSHFVVECESYFKINPRCEIFYDEHCKWFYNDVCVLFLCSIYNLKTCYINKPLTNYLIHDKTVSAKLTKSDSVLPFWDCQKRYVEMIDKNYMNTYINIVKVSFTYKTCLLYLKKHNYKKVREIYKNNKIISKELNLNSYYLYSTKGSHILYKIPFIYLIYLKTNLFNKNLKKKLKSLLKK